MEYKNLSEIVLAAKTTREGRVIGSIRYTILFKKAVCTYIKEGQTNKTTLSLQSGIKVQTLNKWLAQDAKGLLTLEGACCVSPRAKAVNVNLLEQLQKDAREIKLKIDLIIQCKELGLTVS